MGWRKSWIRRGGYRGDVGAPVGRRGKQSTKNERHTRGTNKQERPDTEHTRARPNKGDPPSTERESETSLGARARERVPTESSTESSTGERALTESREAPAEQASAEQASAEQASAEQAPAEQAPAEQAPAEQASSSGCETFEGGPAAESSTGARARERAPTESSTGATSGATSGERALTESREASAERTWSSGGRSSHEFTLESGIAELEHDVVRLDWAERDAYGRLLAAIQEHDSTREAYARWRSVRERRLVAEARLDVLQAARRASRRQGR